MTQQMYMEPVSPWAARNATQLDRLRARVREAEAEAAGAEDWTARTRAEQEAKGLRRELETAEFEARLDAQRQAQHQEPAGTAPAANAAHGQQYAEPVPYWKTETERATVGNAAPKWPQTFAGRAALVAEACAELRRIRAFR